MCRPAAANVWLPGHLQPMLEERKSWNALALLQRNAGHYKEALDIWSNMGQVRACVRACVRMYVRACVRAHVCACVRACGRVCVRASVRAFVRVCLCLCVCLCRPSCRSARLCARAAVPVRARFCGSLSLSARACVRARAFVCVRGIHVPTVSLPTRASSLRSARPRAPVAPSRELHPALIEAAFATHCGAHGPAGAQGVLVGAARGRARHERDR